ncbi:MAG: O-antigen ligase family protein [candidate division WOR-3 bacterium]|nr:O-antigen ligase family protein [candidate division WOR-3 bacterium]
MIVEKRNLNLIFVGFFIFLLFLFFILNQKYNFLTSFSLFLIPIAIILIFFYPEIGLNLMISEPILYFILPLLPITEGLRRASLVIFLFLLLIFAFLYSIYKNPKIVNNLSYLIKEPIYLLLILIGISLFISVLRLPFALSEYGYVKFFSYLLLSLLPSFSLLFINENKKLERFIYFFILFLSIFFIYALFRILLEGLENVLENETIPYRLGFSLSVITFGRWAGIGVFSLFLLFFMGKNRLIKILSFILIPLLLYLLLLSGTRGAILALIVSLFIFFFLKIKNLKEKVVFIFFFILLFFIFYSFLPTMLAERLFYFQDESSINRLEAFSLAFKNFLDSPIFGKGLGSFPYYAYNFIYPHNIFAEFASETGFLGLIPFIIFLILCFKKVFKKLQEKSLFSLFSAFLFIYTFIHSQFSLDIGSNFLLFFAGALLALKGEDNG